MAKPLDIDWASLLSPDAISMSLSLDKIKKDLIYKGSGDFATP
jgi:hypothetical protein